MFRDNFDTSVSLDTETHVTITINKVSGDGLMLHLSNRMTEEKTQTGLTHEEVLNLIEVLQEAEKYIAENK